MTGAPIALSTYDDSLGRELDPRDATFISEHLAGKVSIRRELSGDRFVLNPGAFAGIVRLPSGGLIRSVPRIPTSNIMRMLAVAHSLPSLRIDDVVQLADLDHMLEFVVEYFADRLEERIEQGLYRAYIETEENLGVVRGRILPSTNIRRNYVTRHRTYCRFTELTWDVPENQVLRYLAHRLSGWPFSRQLQTRLQQIDRRMDEVSRIPFHAEDLDRFVYTRLNASYEPLHRLCQLLLRNMTLSEEQGDHEFVSFLIDVNILFEQFIGQVFVEAVPPSFANVRLQRVDALGWRHVSDGTMRRWGVIRPDIELWGGGRLLAVLDTKYKKTSGESLKNPDFYQVLSYCEAGSTDLGALIYPKSEFIVDDEIRIRNSNKRIKRFAVDLAVPGSELLSEAEGLVRRVCDWLAEVQTLSQPSSATGVRSLLNEKAS